MTKKNCKIKISYECRFTLVIPSAVLKVFFFLLVFVKILFRGLMHVLLNYLKWPLQYKLCRPIASLLFSSENPSIVARWSGVCHVTSASLSLSRVGGCGWDLAVPRPAAGGGAKRARAGCCSHRAARKAPDLPDQPPLAQGANQNAGRAGPVENGDWHGAAAGWTQARRSVTIVGWHTKDTTHAPAQVNWTINLCYFIIKYIFF